MTLAPIDLLHQGLERIIGVYLVDTDDGPALFDCGPSSTIGALKASLAERGLELQDVQHLLLSHVHLDHAGAAGSLVREHPGLRVHVSEIGAPHLVDPERLERSARRLYGDAFDPLWGALEPVPAGNVEVVGDRAVGVEVFPTPGHASHHVSYLAADGTLHAGDAVGVRIQPGRYVFPAAPPPDVDLEGWKRTFEEIERRRPARFAMTHFGVAEDTEDHLARMREELARAAERVRSGMSQDEFMAAVREDIVASDEADVAYYERAGPVWQTYLGLQRFWEKQAEAAGA
ncbi:MAG TPA: MBL fold metallo-hydrolase [Gaiellaceae bacterium]|nr:MBL fold metallo-hydrolase [Gaiellaceae bacterium]